MPLTRIKATATGDDSITTAKLDDTSGGFTLPGTQFVKVPVGTTAQRPGSPAGGHLRFNTTLGVLEQYNLNTNAWASIDSPPLIASLAYTGSVTAVDPAGGETITLTGSNFQSGATVTVGGTSATSVTVVSTTSITFTTPAKTAGDYDVVLANTNGLAATLSNGISYNGTPTYSTAAGNIGSIENGSSMSTITIVVAEPDGGNVTQSITSGALPTGLSISSAGAITGTPNISGSNSTTFNFTVTATDDENQTNNRAFNLVVLREIYALKIANSLRFDGAGYLEKLLHSAGNRKLWTWAAWVKRCKTFTEETIFMADDGTNDYVNLKFTSTNEFQITYKHGSATGGSASGQTRRKITKQRFEDSSAWYHILVNFDAANETCSLYVNGEQINKFSTNEQPQNLDFAMNTNDDHYIGRNPSTVTSVAISTFSGLMSDIYFVDAQALTPTSFTELYRGALAPKAYSGSFGLKGYHLEFSDSSDLGKDTSQNYTLVTGTYGGGTTNYTNQNNAFDGDISTSVDRAASNGIIEITPASPVTPVFHSITTVASAAYSSASRPNNVQLEGSNDGGSNWTVINTISNTTSDHSTATSNSFVNTTSYAKLRLNITSNNGGSNTRFSEYKVISSESGGGLSLNSFTSNGMSTHDKIKGSPTNNFCTFNESATRPNTVISFTQGGYKFENTTVHKAAYGNQSMSSGKWYWEARVTGGNKHTIGVTDVLNLHYKQSNATNHLIGNTAATSTYGDAVGAYADNFYKNNSTVQSSVFGGYAQNDVMMCAYDADSGYVYFGKNGTWNNGAPGRGTAGTTWQGTSSYDVTVDATQIYVPAFSLEQPSKWTVNWGQDSTFAGYETAASNADANGVGEFLYPVPTGFLALTSKNKPNPVNNNVVDDTPQKRFNIASYVGNAALSRAITGLGFNPDFVWFGNRSVSRTMNMYDTVRGVTLGINSDTDANQTAYTNGLLSFDSDGFTIGDKNNSNGNTENMVAWCWKAGGAPTATNVAAAGAVPTSGSVMIDGVTSTAALAGTQPAKKISASNKTGLSIVLCDGTSSNITVAHGLNGAPEMVWAKSITTGTQNTFVQHKDAQTSGAETAYLNLDSAGAVAATVWNDTLASSTVVSLGTGNSNNSGSETILYCWKSVEGMTKVGAYNGNQSNAPGGVYVHLGFKPALVAVKCWGESSEWIVFDNVRHDGGNYQRYPKYWSINSPAENITNTNRYIDFLSNGFMVHGNSASGLVSRMNQASDHIYLAFAEDPFKYAEGE